MNTTQQEEMEKRFDERFPSPDGRDFIGMERISEIKAFVKSEIDRAVAERDREVVDIIRKGNYELEEWYSSAERPRDISVFDANQRNIATRNKILSLITKEK